MLNDQKIATVGALVFVGNVGEEELRNLRGMKHLFKEHLDINGMVALEPAPDGTVLVLGTGSHRHEVNIKGPGGHSYAAFGEVPSAIHGMGRAIAKIAEIRTPQSPKTTFTVGTVGGGTSVNTIAPDARMAVDIRSRKPRLANVIGGLSGPAIKPVALRCVWQVCNAVKIPVIGIGGITCAQDVLEFILVGAHAVEIGTMNFVRPDAAFRIAEELPHLCQQLGIKNLAEFRGTLQL